MPLAPTLFMLLAPTPTSFTLSILPTLTKNTLTPTSSCLLTKRPKATIKNANDEKSDFKFSFYGQLIGVFGVLALANTTLSSRGWLIGIFGVPTLANAVFSSRGRIFGVPALPNAERVLLAE